MSCWTLRSGVALLRLPALAIDVTDTSAERDGSRRCHCTRGQNDSERTRSKRLLQGMHGKKLQGAGMSHGHHAGSDTAAVDSEATQHPRGEFGQRH